jgi:hypothetical protein
MLDRIGRYCDYLSDEVNSDDENLIDLHSRTGRPLGCADFVRKLEAITGEELAPKRVGCKPAIRK